MLGVSSRIHPMVGTLLSADPVIRTEDPKILTVVKETSASDTEKATL